MVILGGLPRSGSTLLSALLRQNPDIDVTPTGFLLGMLEGMRNQWTASDPRKAWRDQDEAQARLHAAMRGAVAGYLGAARIGIEKSRGAFALIELLQEVVGEPPKIIAPVRDLRGCLASMEKLWRANPEHSGFGAGTNIGDRVGGWMATDAPPLGTALSQMRDAFHRGAVGNVLFVRFEDLTANPARELRRVYDYIGEPYPEGIHDFEAVADINREHDAIHGPFGDHELHQGEVRPVPEDWEEYLGPVIAQQVPDNNRWFYEDFYPERLAASAA
ncbi:MAG TPA: sulfotransferase [Gammaproteobacteria bacterium]|nr:sulfotransferase [Gammaproteobacteria bacterium]